MLGSLLRMAMLAGTGAGMANSVRHAMLKLACLLAVALVLGLLVAGAIGTFGIALFYALTPQFGAAGGAAMAGLLLLVVAALIAWISHACLMRRRRRVASAAASDLGGPLDAAALGASLGAGPDLDIRGMLSRNAVTVMLAAFIAGMVMNNRR